MKRTIGIAIVLIGCSAAAFAEEKGSMAKGAAPAAGQPDMSKVGPWSRKPTNEKLIKQEIATFFKQEEEMCKHPDVEAAANRVDFPVYMSTDDSKGNAKGELWTRGQWITVMKPMMENHPKDAKMTNKPTITVLSDSIVSVVNDFAITNNGVKMSGKSSGLLIKKDGQWKWKAMTEAGWGDMPTPPATP